MNETRYAVETAIEAVKVDKHSSYVKLAKRYPIPSYAELRRRKYTSKRARSCVITVYPDGSFKVDNGKVQKLHITVVAKNATTA